MQASKNRWTVIALVFGIVLLVHFGCGSNDSGTVHKYATDAFGERIGAATYGPNGLPVLGNAQTNTATPPEPAVSTPPSLFPTSPPAQQ